MHRKLLLVARYKPIVLYVGQLSAFLPRQLILEGMIILAKYICTKQSGAASRNVPPMVVSLLVLLLMPVSGGKSGWKVGLSWTG